MEVFELDADLHDARSLSQVVLQAARLLGLYDAELARILGLQCPDIGQLSAARMFLQPGTAAGLAAGQLVRCYQSLHHLTQGDGVTMWHWLRIPCAALGAVPHRLMVDEGRIAAVLAFLESPDAAASLAARLPQGRV